MLGRVSAVEKMLFTQELTLYLKSAVPLNEALETLGAHERLPSFRRIIRTLLEDVENGQPLAQSLRRFPKVFDELYVSLVEIGELSGTLPKSLEHLTHFLERSYTLRKKVQSIFLYPSIIVSVALLLGIVITIYILPQLVRLFGSFRIELPLSTKLLLGFSQFIEHYGWWVLLGIGIGMLVTRSLLLIPMVWHGWQRLLIAVPGIGRFLRQYYLASFFHDTGILLKSGMPIAQVFGIEKRSHQHIRFRQLAADLERSLQEGRGLWQEIETKYAYLVPPLVAKMIAVGERSGKLEDTFFYLSDFFDQEVERSIKNFTVLLEPILLIVIGGVVAFIATAILAPIYSLTGSIRR